MGIDYNSVVSAISVLAGIIVSTFYARRAKKAEVYAKEIENTSLLIKSADEMVDLVKKANAEVVENQKKLINELKDEIEKTRKSVDRLEHAIKRIDLCTYRNQCPVYDELQKSEGNHEGRGKNNHRSRHGNSQGHNGNGTAGQSANSGAAGV